MRILTESIYCIIESIILTSFITLYFKPKQSIDKRISCSVTFASISIFDIIVTFIEVNWIVTLILSVIILFGLLKTFYRSSFAEQILIPITIMTANALINLSVISCIITISAIEYSNIITRSDYVRTLCILATKLIYIIFLGLMLSFKKRYIFLFHKVEYITMSISLIISGILITLVRNMIYKLNENAGVFLLIILCVLCLNIVLYFTMVYISKKNIDERNMAIMKKQIEMQENSIHSLEEKYDNTTKFRHDVKNYILSALNMAEQAGNTELAAYLKDISEYKLNAMSGYVKTDRNILGAVLNSKLSYAHDNDINVKCTIMSNMDNIADIDIGILLANLLDNAVEACKHNSGSSELSIRLWNEAGYYCIDIANTVENDVLSDNPDLKTQKQDKEMHGLGLRTVYDIVEKYNGMISFKQKSNMFHVYVNLSNI